MSYLGKSGLRVSELALGTWTFGPNENIKIIGDVDQKEADVLVNMALDAGVNFFDTADVYSKGQSEEILGKALGKRRKDVILATKVRARMSPNPNDVGLSRHHILEGCDGSLRRLGTDYIDLYQVHSFDFNTPLDETLRTLDDIVRQGKVRYIGCSNFAGWQLMKALGISKELGLEKFITLQAMYSLLARDLEYELAPLCLDQGLGILTWGPLAGGALSGKYRHGKPAPQGARLSTLGLKKVRISDHDLDYDEEKVYKIVDELEIVAKAHNSTITQTALNYLLKKPGVTSVIFGARTPEQLADNLKTTNWEMGPEEVAQLDKVSEPAPVYPSDFLSRHPHD